jgi:tetratricopeptide (TPR) repeat protein
MINQYHHTAYFRRGQSKYSIDDYPRAIDDFMEIQKNNSYLVARSVIMLDYAIIGRLKEAEKEYERAESESTRSNGYYNLG